MVRKLDFFGKAVFLNFRGSKKSQTRAGAIFTVIFLAYIVWCIYYVSQDLFKREEPITIINSESFDENPGPMVLSPDTFSFGFGLQDPDTSQHYINQSIYTVSVSYNQQQRIVSDDAKIDVVWTTVSLETEACTKSHFGDIGGSFADLPLDMLFCLKQKQPHLDEIQLQGVVGSPTYQYISVTINQCQNSTSNGTCATQEKLDSLLFGGLFTAYYPNTATDLKNFSYPNRKYQDSTSTTVTNNYFKQTTMWLNHLEVESDLGWLVSNPKTKKYIKLDQIKELTNYNQDPTGFFRFVVRVGKLKTHYRRSYTKIQDISAKVSGLTTFGFFAALIFVVPYSYLKFYESLINELFDVKMLRQNKKNSKKAKKDSKTSSEKNIDAPVNLGLTVSPTPVVPPNNQDPNLLSANANIIGDTPVPINAIGEESTIKIKNENEDKEAVNESFLDTSSTAFKRESRDKEILREDSQSLSHKINGIRLLPIQRTPIRPYVYPNAQETKTIEAPMYVKPIDSVKLKSKLANQSEGTRSFTDKIDLEDSYIEKHLSPPQAEEKEAVQEDQAVKNKIAEDDKKVLDKQKDATPGYGVGMFPLILTTKFEKIDISFFEYIRSFVWSNPAIDEKAGLLKEGMRRINERLDIFNMFKKLREIDKLKLLLLDKEQLVLFNGLPKPHLMHKEERVVSARRNTRTFSHLQLREARFVSENKMDKMLRSYKDLKGKSETTMIDKKLIEIYDEVFIGQKKPKREACLVNDVH